MVRRVVHLGFEVRVELELPDGTQARAQLTRAQAEELELDRRRHRLRPPSGGRADRRSLRRGQVGSERRSDRRAPAAAGLSR